MFGGFPFGQPTFGDGPAVDLTVVPPITQPEICAAVNIMVGQASLGVDVHVAPTSQANGVQVDGQASLGIDIGVSR